MKQFRYRNSLIFPEEILKDKGYIMIPAGLLLLSSAIASGDLADHYHYDFRQYPVKPGSLKFIGSGAKERIHFQRGGAQFILPATTAETTPVGLGPQFVISGDFEITMAFEVLQEAKPSPECFGLNINIYIDTNTTHGATITRSHRPQEGIQLIAHTLVRGGEEKHTFHTQNVSTKFASGQLRLKRVGSKLLYLAAEGAAAPFQQVQEADWVASDIHQVRFGGNNSKADTPFQFRILSVDIKADELPSYERPQQATPWLLILMLALVVTAIAAAGVWWWRSRRQAAADESSNAT